MTLYYEDLWLSRSLKHQCILNPGSWISSFLNLRGCVSSRVAEGTWPCGMQVLGLMCTYICRDFHFTGLWAVCFFDALLRITPRASTVRDKCCTSTLHTQPLSSDMRRANRMLLPTRTAFHSYRLLRNVVSPFCSCNTMDQTVERETMVAPV